MAAIGASSLALAQSVTGDNSTAPIFISPYAQGSGTYINNIPTIVQPTPKAAPPKSLRTGISRTADKDDKGGYQIKPVKNPYEGTAYTRIRSEKDYYDDQTKQYYNQYDYMKLLADRGDDAKLAQVRGYLQKNGVFNPEKYNVSMTGGASSSSATGQGGASSTGNTTADGRPRIILQKEDDSADGVPQKLHSGYDDDQAVIKNRPIFLR